MINKHAKPSRAEQRFRAAFERLKAGKPLLLDKGAEVTQNNVAKEAGVQPSALRSSRFPDLTREIREWVLSALPKSQVSRQQSTVKLRQKNNQIAKLKLRISGLTEQRDNALSMLSSANSQILDLVRQIRNLQAENESPNVRSIRSSKREV